MPDTDDQPVREPGLDFVKQFIGTKYEAEVERIAPELVAQAKAEMGADEEG